MLRDEHVRLLECGDLVAAFCSLLLLACSIHFPVPVNRKKTMTSHRTPRRRSHGTPARFLISSSGKASRTNKTSAKAP